MERELWRRIRWGLKRLARWCPRGGVYDNRQVLAVLLWAALHERSVNWATKREHWPFQAWRRRLPDQSTMSRRLREPRLPSDLLLLVLIIQRRWGVVSDRLVVDGKPLPVSYFSGDPDARMGWGAGRHMRGYKLHALIDSAQRLLAWEVHPMNIAECTVAAELLRQARRHGALPPGATLRGDPSYDSNPLHREAAHARVCLIAPRRKPRSGISTGHRQHPGRLASIRATEGPGSEPVEFEAQRREIERFFGSLVGFGGGLTGLPAWVRRLHRVRVWTGAKLVINCARLDLRRAVAA